MQHYTMLFSQRRTIVPDDTDAAGIVYTPRIPQFVVEVIESWFDDRLQMDLNSGGPHIVFASLSCTFLAPMRPGDVLQIRVALGRVGRSSLGFEIVGHRESDKRMCWMAETVCVFIDQQSFRSRLVPDALREPLRAEAALAARMPLQAE